MRPWTPYELRFSSLVLFVGVVACSPSLPEPRSHVGMAAPSAPSSAGAPAGAVLRVDFERQPLGPYGQAALESDFPGARAQNGLGEGRATIVLTERGKSLRVLYPKGAVGPGAGGLQFMVPISGARDELRCAYRVRFGPSFDFVKGGKLPGLVGGSHPTGGHARDDGFSARMMWRKNGAAVQYLYFPGQPTTYGVDLPYAVAGREARFNPGAWHWVEHRIRMNSPGRADGVLQAWFDGQLALDAHDRVFRLDEAVHVDAFYFSTFFGGNDASWAATQDETVDFDDFVISTDRAPR